MSAQENPIGEAILKGASFERIREQDGTPRNQILITQVRVVQGPVHDVVHVWNRGGHSGTLLVRHGDGIAIARALLPDARIELLHPMVQP